MEEKYIVKQLKEQLESFVEAMATAIDERTPYNGNHTRNVAKYVIKIAKKINEKYEEGKTEEYFDDERIEKLRLAALLHDIGKMVISKRVMNRATRMDGDIDRIAMRFELIKSLYEIDYLKGKITKEIFDDKCVELDRIYSFIQVVDSIEYLAECNFIQAQRLRNKFYLKENGEKLNYLTEDEIAHLSIRHGTLTENERILMQSHVEMTSKILSKVQFTKDYNDVPKWAGMHHEFLDGSGYPNHLKEEEIPIEARMLTVADIFDALTATDRPYKKPMSIEDAFLVMFGMANAGKIESELVKLLEEAVS